MNSRTLARVGLVALCATVAARLIAGTSTDGSTAAADQTKVPALMRTTFSVHDFQPGVDRTGPINWIARNPSDVREVFASSVAGGLWRSTDRGFRWALVSSLPSGSVSAAAFMFDGTPGGAVLVTTEEDFRVSSGAGVWRSDDHGGSWRQVGRVSDGVGCPAIPRAYSIAVRDTRAWVATNCGVLASADGRTFDMLPAGVFARGALTGSNQQYFYSVDVTPSGAVLLGGDGGILYQFARATGPAGMSLQMTGDSGEMRHAFGISPSTRHPEFVLALSGGQGTHTILISKDNGRTWSAVRSRRGAVGGAGGSPFIRIVPSVDDPESLYVYHGNSHGLAVAGPFPDGDLSQLADNPIYPWQPITVGHPDTHDIDFSDLLAGPLPVPPRLFIDREGRRRPPSYFRTKALLMATDGGLEICRFAAAAPLPTCNEASVLGADSGLSSFMVMRVNGQIIGSGESARRRVYVQTWHTDRYVSADGGAWKRRGGEGAWLDMERRVDRVEDAQVLLNYNATPNFLADDQFQRCAVLSDTANPGSNSPTLLLRKGVMLEVDSTTAATTLMGANGVSLTPAPVADATCEDANTRVTWRPLGALQVCNSATRACAPIAIQNPLILGGLTGSDRSNVVVYQPYAAGLYVVRGRIGATGLTGVTSGPALMIWRDSAGAAQPVRPGIAWMPFTGFNWRSVVGVDPLVPTHLLIADVINNRVMQSFDAGQTWFDVPGLSSAVVQDESGATTSVFTVNRGGFGTQSMVSAISFYPEYPNLVVAGTVSNGLFFSDDRGENWRRIPGTSHITNVVDLYWRSANSVLVGSWGRGVFEVQMRHALSPASLRLICGDCRFMPVAPSRQPHLLLSIRPQQGGSEPSTNQTPAFDEAILVVGGAINGLQMNQGQPQKMTATVGSSVYRFGGLNASNQTTVDERGGFPGFVGLPAADQLRKEKQIIRGIALTNGRVTHVIYGPTEVPQPTPSPLPQNQVPSVPSPSPAEPFLRIVGSGVYLGTMVGGASFELQGYFFAPNAPLDISVDGQAVSQSRTDGRGQFTVALIAPPAIGPHVVSARQQVAGRTVQTGTGFAVNNSDGLPRPPQPSGLVASVVGAVAAPAAVAAEKAPPPVAGKAEPPSGTLVTLPRAIPASELRPGATASAGELRLVAGPADRGPAGSSLEWTNVTPGDRLMLTVETGVTGPVNMYASFRRGPDAASVQVLFDGREVGRILELAAPAPTTAKLLIGSISVGPEPARLTLVVTPSKAGAPQRVSLLGLSIEK